MKGQSFSLHVAASLKSLLWASMAMAALPVSAQFTVLTQKGGVFVDATFSSLHSAPGDMTAFIQPGSVTGQRVSDVDFLTDEVFDIRGHAELETVISESFLGLSDEIALSFQRLGQDSPLNYQVQGRVSALASLTFTTQQATDIKVAISLPPRLTFSDGAKYGHTVSLFKQGTKQFGFMDFTGKQPFQDTPVSVNNGVAHLDQDVIYVLAINSTFTSAGSLYSPGFISGEFATLVTPNSLPRVAASISITAVPEASSLWMVGIGMVGLAAAHRRKHHQA